MKTIEENKEDVERWIRDVEDTINILKTQKTKLESSINSEKQHLENYKKILEQLNKQ